jgi:hypothetical protein
LDERRCPVCRHLWVASIITVTVASLPAARAANVHVTGV